MSPRFRVLSLALPVLALAAALGSSATGCSSTTTVAPGAGDTTLPCCHGGFIYRCANQGALSACGDAAQDDTTDCTKTSTTCGGGGGGTAKDAGPTVDAAVKKTATGGKCDVPADCEGDLCLVVGSGTVGFCSSVCASSGDCPSRFSCEFAEKLGAKICVAMGEKRVGEACSAGGDCVSGICLKSQDGGVGFCTAPCASPSECPAGFGCAAVGGNAGKYCVK